RARAWSRPAIAPGRASRPATAGRAGAARRPGRRSVRSGTSALELSPVGADGLVEAFGSLVQLARGRAQALAFRGAGEGVEVAAQLGHARVDALLAGQGL